MVAIVVARWGTAGGGETRLWATELESSALSGTTPNPPASLAPFEALFKAPFEAPVEAPCEALETWDIWVLLGTWEPPDRLERRGAACALSTRLGRTSWAGVGLGAFLAFLAISERASRCKWHRLFHSIVQSQLAGLVNFDDRADISGFFIFRPE